MTIKPDQYNRSVLADIFWLRATMQETIYMHQQGAQTFKPIYNWCASDCNDIKEHPCKCAFSSRSTNIVFVINNIYITDNDAFVLFLPHL
jgi:hypothetical protein